MILFFCSIGDSRLWLFNGNLDKFVEQQLLPKVSFHLVMSKGERGEAIEKFSPRLTLRTLASSPGLCAFSIFTPRLSPEIRSSPRLFASNRLSPLTFLLNFSTFPLKTSGNYQIFLISRIFSNFQARLNIILSPPRLASTKNRRFLACF